jgi:coenzyme F420 biosynthesis associated uncharacterized protein
LQSATGEATEAVLSYTGLEPAGALPEPEWVSRKEWAEINLGSLRESLVPVERRLAADGRLAGMLEGAIGASVGRLAAVQLGSLVGYGSRRVLGQFEFPILGEADRSPRLIFVATNIEGAQAELGADPETVLRWIALHEVTHAVHFTATPWLRPYLSGLAAELIEGSRLGIGPRDLLALAGRVVGSDPRELARELAASDPLTLLSPPDSRALLAQVQAAMAAVEGFAEHVMDAAAPLIGEQIGELRESMERRRDRRGPLARLLAWLLGIELKLRQYRDGKRFVDEVVGVAGIATLNRAWDSPGALPTGDELAAPDRWLKRTAADRAAAA